MTTTETTTIAEQALDAYGKWYEAAHPWPGNELWEAERNVTTALRAGDIPRAHGMVDVYGQVRDGLNIETRLRAIIATGERLTALVQQDPDGCVAQSTRYRGSWCDLVDQKIDAYGHKTKGAAKGSNTRLINQRVAKSVSRARAQLADLGVVTL